MSLNWSIENVKDYKQVCLVPIDDDPEKRRLSNLTDALIWATMAVDLGQITINNIDKWQERLHVLSQMQGALLSVTTDEGKRTRRDPTREEMVAHIGLSTNVSSLPDTKWKTRIWARMMDEAKREVARERREYMEAQGG